MVLGGQGDVLGAGAGKNIGPVCGVEELSVELRSEVGVGVVGAIKLFVHLRATGTNGFCTRSGQASGKLIRGLVPRTLSPLCAFALLIRVAHDDRLVSRKRLRSTRGCRERSPVNGWPNGFGPRSHLVDLGLINPEVSESRNHGPDSVNE